ncbi:glycolipid 2-alpha-mannosyltransferase-domain-containing protein [Mycena rebaudengoi]|nr:glycolipid 2-alpha-mannosyltransferase-domain-containing protein [Mycena rebaudengoi]
MALMSSGRYLLIVLIVLSGHFLLSLTHDAYARATSWSRLRQPTPIPQEYYTYNQTLDVKFRDKANATFIILARNSDMDNTVRSMRRMEDRFNTRRHYPYVLLNDEPFTEEFMRRTRVIASGGIEFGTIDPLHWKQPDWIDEERAKAGRDQMVVDNIIYGGSVSSRNMCRFNSGFFFRHPLVQKYRWYWRIEPDVHFHCDINFTPFLLMQDQGKVYGWTITMYEFDKTIPTLWGHVKGASLLLGISLFFFVFFWGGGFLFFWRGFLIVMFFFFS